MNDGDFAALKAQMPTLTPAQFKELVKAYAGGSGTSDKREWDKAVYVGLEQYLAELKVNRACPACGSVAVVSDGFTEAGVQQFKCTDCGAGFTRFYHTLLERSRFPWEVWVEALRMTLNGDSIKDMQSRLVYDFGYACAGINIKTVFELRRKLIYAMASIEPPKLSGVIQIDESFLRESQKGTRELVSYLKGEERKPRRGCQPSKYGTMGPEFATILTAIDSRGYCVCEVAAMGRMPVDAVIDLYESRCIDAAFLCSDANSVYTTACDLLNIPHYVKPSDYTKVIANSDFRYASGNLTYEQLQQNNRVVMEKLYRQGLIDRIEHREDLTYDEFNEIKQTYKLNISRINELHKDIKLLLEKRMTNVSTKYLPAYVRAFAFRHNWRVEHSHSPANSADSEAILQQLVGLRLNLTRPEMERITLTLPTPSGRAVQLLKEKTEAARQITKNKYFKYDSEDLPSFNKREILLDAPRAHLLEIAKAHKIKGYTKMTQWGLAAAIAKLDDAEAIIVDLIMKNRAYEIDEEDVKYIQSLRFRRKKDAEPADD